MPTCQPTAFPTYLGKAITVQVTLNEVNSSLEYDGVWNVSNIGNIYNQYLDVTVESSAMYSNDQYINITIVGTHNIYNRCNIQ
jgi:hypothetical protein